MELKEFKTKSYPHVAIQWDGSIEQAKRIINWVRTALKDEDVDKAHVHYELHLDGSATDEDHPRYETQEEEDSLVGFIRFDSPFNLGRLRKGDWIVLNVNGDPRSDRSSYHSFRIYEDNYFREIFEVPTDGAA